MFILITVVCFVNTIICFIFIFYVLFAFFAFITTRLQYRLDTANRLADEHALIATYVSRLQNGTRLVWGKLSWSGDGDSNAVFFGRFTGGRWKSPHGSRSAQGTPHHWSLLLRAYMVLIWCAELFSPFIPGPGWILFKPKPYFWCLQSFLRVLCNFRLNFFFHLWT